MKRGKCFGSTSFWILGEGRDERGCDYHRGAARFHLILTGPHGGTLVCKRLVRNRERDGDGWRFVKLERREMMFEGMRWLWALWGMIWRLCACLGWVSSLEYT